MDAKMSLLKWFPLMSRTSRLLRSFGDTLSKTYIYAHHVFIKTKSCERSQQCEKKYSIRKLEDLHANKKYYCCDFLK